MMAAEVEEVTLAKGHKGLGIRIRGGSDYPFVQTEGFVDPGIFIVGINDDGFARQDGRLKVGDKIITVNGRDVTSVTHREFVRLFAAAAAADMHLSVVHDAVDSFWRRTKKWIENQAGDQGLLPEACDADVDPTEELKSCVPEKNRGESDKVPVSPSISLTSRPDEGEADSLASLVSDPEDIQVDEVGLNGDSNGDVEVVDEFGPGVDLIEPTSIFDEEEERDEEPRPMSSLGEATWRYWDRGERPVLLEPVVEGCEEEEEDDAEGQGIGTWERPEKMAKVGKSVAFANDDDLSREVPLADLDDDAAFDDHEDEDDQDRTSLDSDSDEELKKCRESVCPDSHEVTPRSSATRLSVSSLRYGALSAPPESSTEEVDSDSLHSPEVGVAVSPGSVSVASGTASNEESTSCRSSATPDTVVSRTTWSRRSVAEYPKLEVTTDATSCSHHVTVTEPNDDEEEEDEEELEEDEEEVEDDEEEVEDDDEKVTLDLAHPRTSHHDVEVEDIEDDDEDLVRPFCLKHQTDRFETEHPEEAATRVVGPRCRIYDEEKEGEWKEYAESFHGDADEDTSWVSKTRPILCVVAIVSIAAFVVHRQYQLQRGSS